MTPVFDGERFLKETIRSVETQTFSDYEHVIVDDGSTDGTARILSEYATRDHRARVIRQENAGEARAVNIGVKHALGEYLVILNADDLLSPQHLEKCVGLLDGHAECSAVYPDWLMINGRSQVIRKITTIEFSYRALLTDLICAPGPGTLFRARSLAREWARKEELKYVSDYEMWTHLIKWGPMMRLPEELASWRLHHDNLTSGMASRQLGRELREVIDSIRDEVVPAIGTGQLGRRWDMCIRAKADYFEAVKAIDDRAGHSPLLMLRSCVRKPYPNWGYSTQHRRVLVVFASLAAPFSRVLIRVLNQLRYGAK